jgi:allantoicase
LKESNPASFTGLVDLVCENLGGRALGASDDFFAGVENLLRPGRPCFIEGKFSDRGKWMDGWESRRKRGPGHDFCIIELGASGSVQGFDIDTQYFVGNHPAYAEVHGLHAAAGASFTELVEREWTELLAQAPLAPGSQNLFLARPGPVVSHLKLSIFPDGGVARFRAFGRVEPRFSAPELDSVAQAHLANTGLVDLAALKNGARAVACSDAHFGPMNNLLLPGLAENMGAGWETRRSRAPLHEDWVVVELAARGTLAVLEVDTSHFKGNYPERCAVELLDAGVTRRISELIASRDWTSVLSEQQLRADHRHFFGDLSPHGPATHLRLRILPDGGLSRLRAWGRPNG